MSDFSSGIMIPATFKELAKKYREEDTYLIKLGDAWICRLSENDFCEMVAESYSEAVLNLSVHVPLMHVINAEDHGFGLCILHQKKVVFHLHVQYAVESEFAFNIGQELYGDEYMELIMDQKVHATIANEVRRRYSEIDETIQSFFSEINQDSMMQFKLFGFDDDACNKMKNILTIENYKKDDYGHQMIKALMSVLMLSKFSFVSYEYVNSDEDIFETIE